MTSTMKTVNVELTSKDLMLLLEALEHRASRHDSMSRANPRAGKPHDDASVAMRVLRARLIRAGSAFQKEPA